MRPSLTQWGCLAVACEPSRRRVIPLHSLLDRELRFIVRRASNRHLIGRVIQTVKRFFGAPDFHYYALASGIATLFSRLGRWKPPPKPPPNPADGFQLTWPFLLA